MAGCQKRQMSITLATLTKNTKAHTHTHRHTERQRETDRQSERDNLRTQNYKERKDSEITQHEITQYDCDTGVSNTMSSYQDTITE